MKAVAFDLGDTLVEYEGIPLSWENLYPSALRKLTELWQIGASETRMKAANEVLRRFNTRIYDRRTEVTFATILQQLAACFDYQNEGSEIPAARAFFGVFRQHLRCFSDAKMTLELLREKHFKCAVFTDVPYGMPRELVLEDIAEAGLMTAFDLIMTSGDVGFRKPAIETLQTLARQMGCSSDELLYIGNERKDIEVAHVFGCKSVLIDRAGLGSQWGQSYTVQSLAQIPDLVVKDD